MKRKSLQGFRPEQRAPAAANEDFDSNGSSRGAPSTGWDAYEVWRTRVKVAARHTLNNKKEEREPLR